jgi:hypothetical protein
MEECFIVAPNPALDAGEAEALAAISRRRCEKAGSKDAIGVGNGGNEC